LTKLIETTKEAAKEGFKNIKTVRGLVVNIDVQDAPASWNTTTQNVVVSLEEAAILEYFEEGDQMELKDNKFSFSYKYAEPGKKPKAVLPYMKCLVASAEKMGKKPSDFIGKVATFSKIPVVGFKKKNEETGQMEDVEYKDHFSFVPDANADSGDTIAYVKKLVTGLGIQPALRALMMDERAKQFPEFKDALKAGTLAEKLGLKLVEDKFVEV